MAAGVAGHQAPGYCRFVEALGTGAPHGRVGRDPPDQALPGQLAEEQAALRRVATLVARATPPKEVFAAVAEEVGELLRVELVTLIRYEPDRTATPVTTWGPADENFPVGVRWPLEGHNLTTLVFKTGRPARIDRYADSSSGPFSAGPRESGIRSAVGTPVIVEGSLWGVIFAGSTLEQPLPPGTETRLASFTELLATAIANTESRAALARLAEEQAALRRVAVLVARATPPEQVLAAVAEEVGGLLGVDYTVLIRSDPQDMITVVGGWTATGVALPSPAGSRFEVGGKNVSTLTLRTGRPARLDAYVDVTGSIGTTGAQGWGFRSSVGVPISVEGRPWGLILVAYTRDQQLPPDTETRLASFTELLATAIANTESRAALARLAEEQAALRRVATLAAREVPQEELFAAVTEEAGRLFLAHSAGMYRYEPDGTLTFVASWGGIRRSLPVGSRWTLAGHHLGTLVFETGRPARIESYAGDSAPGPLGAALLKAGVRSSAGVPITVERRLWGMMGIGATLEQPLPPDAEARLASFTDLVATAIANAQSRAELVASRARIVAAADETRRRIERDLHDGIQQHLVSLMLDLRTVQAAVPPGLAEIEGGLSRIAERVAGVFDHARELSHGIHPAILSERGLQVALKALGRRSAVPVELDLRVEAVGGTLDVTSPAGGGTTLLIEIPV
jgi:GAF domain-containing protein